MGTQPGQGPGRAVYYAHHRARTWTNPTCPFSGWIKTSGWILAVKKMPRAMAVSQKAQFLFPSPRSGFPGCHLVRHPFDPLLPVSLGRPSTMFHGAMEEVRVGWVVGRYNWAFMEYDPKIRRLSDGPFIKVWLCVYLSNRLPFQRHLVSQFYRTGQGSGRMWYETHCGYQWSTGVTDVVGRQCHLHSSSQWRWASSQPLQEGDTLARLRAPF